MERYLAAAWALCMATGCHPSSGGSPDAMPEVGPVPSATVATAASNAGSQAWGSHALSPGSQCDTVKDAAVCSPDGTAQLSCRLGRWQTVYLCDGPAGCKGRGDQLVCDLKPVKEGDPCTSGINPPRCNSRQVLMSCVNKTWRKTTCAAPGTCQAATEDMPAECRLGG